MLHLTLVALSRAVRYRRPPSASAYSSLPPSLSFLPLWMAFFDQIASQYIIPATHASAAAQSIRSNGPSIIRVELPSLSEHMLHSMLREMATAIQNQCRRTGDGGESVVHIMRHDATDDEPDDDERLRGASRPLWFLKCREAEPFQAVSEPMCRC